MSLLSEQRNISVIIPMYNSEKTIIRALDSIKNQTSLHWILEIIVVNDGSKDNSLNLVKEYITSNINLSIHIINKENGGVSSARNIGMTNAKGDWIALLDSDDEWLPNKIELQMKIIDENNDIDFLGGAIDNKELKILWKKIIKLHKANVKEVCLKMFPQTSTAIFKRKIFCEIGGYDEDQKYAEDGNYFVKICNKYNYYYLPVQLVVYDNGKPAFGFSGLSANMKGMYEGNIKNIREYKRSSIISGGFYYFLRIFYFFKYIRRKMLRFIRNLGFI